MVVTQFLRYFGKYHTIYTEQNEIHWNKFSPENNAKCICVNSPTPITLLWNLNCRRRSGTHRLNFLFMLDKQTVLIESWDHTTQKCQYLCQKCNRTQSKHISKRYPKIKMIESKSERERDSAWKQVIWATSLEWPSWHESSPNPF